MAKSGKPEPASPAPEQSHAALARKYRPKTFAELIGQDAMVRTLKNAFATDRIAQAYMLTGVRGVGKTTTARLIARGLNYEKGGEATPTVDFTEEGDHCRAILEGRHLDVIEMDAASHTGIDDIRDIIDSAHYKPNAARYKVYIIDEVHMLSRQAFNGLLKTLEEPPAHVKFIFATTEARKVPVTVLSRTQRFDLKRIETEALTTHLAEVAAREACEADTDALLMIARAAEGSVRDALSILDRAIAFAGGRLDAASVGGLLGLADRGRIYDLLETVLKGEAGEALEQLSRLNRDGAEPAQVIADLADAVHQVTRRKAIGDGPPDPATPQAEQERSAALARTLPMAVLARAWQMLLKGHEEVQNAPRPLAAADMVLVRLCYAANLPSPADLVGRLAQGGGSSGNTPRSDRGAPAGREPAPVATFTPRVPTSEASQPAPEAAGPESFEAVIRLAEANRELKLKNALLEQVRLVSFRPGTIELNLLPSAHKDLVQELGRHLKNWTGRQWTVVVNSEAEGEVPLGQTRRVAREEELRRIREHPSVREVFQHFPDAEIKDIRPLRSSEPPAGEALDVSSEDGDFPDERFSEDGRGR